jgi:DNA (cytosine-5)-methyltransferase 1
MTELEILENIFAEVVLRHTSLSSKRYPKVVVKNIDIMIEDIDKNKSLVSALITSLLKKIITPEQDIRLHRTDFEGGYSARILDTQVTTPFLKKHFPKYANKESGFLSMVTRAQIPWTKSERHKLRTRASKQFMDSFLEILDCIESKKIKPQDTLSYLFEKLSILSSQQKMIFNDTLTSTEFIDIININSVLAMLKKHFSLKLSSRLPVIAIYSIYQHLFRQIKRFDNKVLLPLNVHTSSDKHGYGDIEIRNNDDTPYEVVEIKHNISIDRNLIFDIVKKSQNTSIERYYVLTTAKDNFISREEELYINQFILKIKKDFDIEIIANGIFTTLKYYLRFIEDYNEFIKTYTFNLIEDSKNSTEIKEFHLTEWKNILDSYKIKV